MIVLRDQTYQHIAILLALGLASLSIACSNSKASADLQKELKTIASWTATARTVGEAWKSGSVPPAYATRTFETAQENLKQEIERINSLEISESDKADISTKIQQLENTLGQAVQAVGNRDKSGLDQALKQLTILTEELRRLTQ